MFRTREERLFWVLLLTIFCTASAIGFSWSIPVGALVSTSCATIVSAMLVFTRRRYQRIARLAEEIDVVLHNEDHLYIADAQEGELAVLESEVTKMTRRLREQNQALRRERERLADALADIAHQLRTPLTSANLLLTLAGADTNEQQQLRWRRQTKELFAHMDWLLTALLKLARLDAGAVVFQPIQTEANQLIDAALQPFGVAAELRQIDLQRSASSEVLKCDFRWTVEALQNLIKNSMESIGSDGTITITCVATPLFTEILIHDSGPGFRPEDMARLFERFYRLADSETEGYGLGMALAHRIITAQGGSLTAQNHPNGGAAFTLRFPPR